MDNKLSTKADTSSIPNMSSYYTKSEVDNKVTTSSSSISGYTLGQTIGNWVVCAISKNSIMLFPTSNLTTNVWSTAVQYCSSYNSSPIDGLKVYWSKIPSISDIHRIVAATGIGTASLIINDDGRFWLSDYGFNAYNGSHHYIAAVDRFYTLVDTYGSGARPLITLVKS